MVENGYHEEAQNKNHIPVLIEEVTAWLQCQPGKCYLDCTLGYGGLAFRILVLSEPSGRLIGIDQDAMALAAARERLGRYETRVHLIKGNFKDLKHHLHSLGVSIVDGIVFDLGVSSPQLDRADRGFSFTADGILDMRMDRQSSGRTAADLINHLPESELADVIFRYGEERYSRRIAAAIIRTRRAHPLRTTGELTSVIQRAVPPSYRHGRIHYATRTFQGLRIAVNRELDVLEPALRDAVDVLAPSGRLCAVSFHSLEDRIVKQTFRSLSQQTGARLAVLTKKPQTPSDEERRRNPRSRSAKLRVAERVAKETFS
ncbi:MAG: 16S rRNA (cytosine(1402)-N(4))-methyltransferase RsmH [Nitrospiraceae bacterium]